MELEFLLFIVVMVTTPTTSTTTLQTTTLAPPKTIGSTTMTTSGYVGGIRYYTTTFSGPYFDPTQNNNVTTQLGSHAYLPCKVKQLGNKSVSWIRKRDSHILTVDRYTFIADERFQVLHNNAETWTLQIKYSQSRDEGLYECQVTTEPKMSYFVNLQVVVPQTKILGGETDVFVKSGSSVVIKCVITDSLEQPDYIFWYHDGGRVLSIQQIQQSNSYQHVERLSSDTTLGMLVIKSTERRDSGNYTCAPSNLQPASIVLHVLNGEHPAAMQQGSSSTSNSNTSKATNNINTKYNYFLFILIVTIFNNV